MYAKLNPNSNERFEAAPKGRGFCPQCGEEVIAKCGQINIWHWAHRNNFDCVSETETKWHREWKELFPESMREVSVHGHRADVKTPRKVIEFQNSSLSVDDIWDREEEYGDMVWVINGVEFRENFILRDKPYGYSFRWKRPRQVWFNASQPIYIDNLWPNARPGSLFLIKKLHDELPCGGWGDFVNKNDFVKSMLGSYNPNSTKRLI